MAEPVTISLDAMSGDKGAAVVVEAAALELAKRRNLDFILVGDEAVLRPLIASNRIDPARVKIVHTDEVVTMQDSASDAIRKKKKLLHAAGNQPG